MTEHATASPRPSIFAQKGEAEPAPAVAYVSLRQLQGNPERREERSDRRTTQWEDRQSDADSSERREHHGSDHDDRRHFTPRSGLAIGQRYVPWSELKDKADAPQDNASVRKSKSSVSTLSSLINRHRDSFVQPASREPEPVPQQSVATASPATPNSTTPQSPKEQIATGPTKVDLSYLSDAGAQGGRTASPDSRVEPAAPQAMQPPTARTRKLKRKKVTVRLEVEQYTQIKSLADKDGETQQSVVASAVADYLAKLS